MILIIILSIMVNIFAFESNNTIEGEHISWTLKEITTDSIPELALKSSWATIKPIIDGNIITEEWNDATQIVLESQVSNIIDSETIFIGKLLVKNDNNSLYLAFDITADQSNNQDDLLISTIIDENFKVYCNTGQKSKINNPRVNLKHGFITNRMWEIEISREYFEYEILPIKIDFTDNAKFNSANDNWPRIGYKNLALSLSPTKDTHNSASYKTYIKDLTQLLDQNYKLLQNLYGNIPYYGEKIYFVVNYSLEYGGLSGNPIQIKNPYSLSTCFHEIGHAFTFGFWDIRALSESLAEISSIYPYLHDLKSSNILLDIQLHAFNVTHFFSSSRKALLEYERNEEKFKEIDVLTEEFQPPYQAIEVFNGIFCNLIDSYGWEIFSKFSVPCPLFDFLPKSSNTEKMMNILVYRLSLGAKEDLRSVFRERWRMPIIDLDNYVLTEPNQTYVSVNTDAIMDVSSFRYNKSNSSISYIIIGANEDKNYCNLTIPLKLIIGPYEIKINNQPILKDYTSNTNQSHAFISFNTNQTYNKIQISGTSSDFKPPQTIHNYNGSIMEQNFIIQLEAIDDISGVAETLYKINEGPIKKISEDGHPLITEEGYNTLEYWSIDKVDNEETHKLLSEIILTKITPKNRNVSSHDMSISRSQMGTIISMILIGFLFVELLLSTKIR